MSAILMWLGMAVFFFAFMFVNIAKTRQRHLQKLGKQPDAQYKRMNMAARILFAIGMLFWIIGAILTMAGGGK